MTEQETQLTILIDAGDADQTELDELTRQLYNELRELDVLVERPRGQTAPAGTKTGEAVTLGALTLTLLPVLAPKVIDLIQSWLARRQSETVKIKYTLKDRTIEVEHSQSMAPEKLRELVSTLSDALRVGETPATGAPKEGAD